MQVSIEIIYHGLHFFFKSNLIFNLLLIFSKILIFEALSSHYGIVITAFEYLFQGHCGYSAYCQSTAYVVNESFRVSRLCRIVPPGLHIINLSPKNASKQFILVKWSLLPNESLLSHIIQWADLISKIEDDKTILLL